MECQRLLCVLGLLILLAGCAPVGTTTTLFQAGGDPPAHSAEPVFATDMPPYQVSPAATVAPLAPAARSALPPGYVWQIETVDSAGDVGEYTSLALDVNDFPHISYARFVHSAPVDYDLKYAHYDGAAWQIDTVDSAGDVGYFTSLALDAEGHPHVAYGDFTQSALKYASFDGADWQIQTADDQNGASSLILDVAEHPHIGHCCPRYTYYDGAAWHTQVVDSGGSNTSLALDSTGRPRISYLDVGPWSAQVKYAAFDGGTWQKEVVAMAGGDSEGTSLALDALDRPRFCYGDVYKNGESYLRYAAFDGASWQIAEVDGGPGASAAGTDCSLVLDADDWPHISYRARWGGLKYAWFDGAAWQIETVDGSQSVGYDTSLVLDSANLPHISYRDTYNSALKYARAVLCRPPAGVAVAGPTSLPVGIGGLYSAAYTPPTATLPVSLTWDNGTVGNAAAYTWTSLGTYPVAVTATNPCGQAYAALTVTVFCQPLTGLAVDGPLATLVGQETTYQAVPQPLTASLPLTYTWDNGRSGRTTSYSWTQPGTYTLSVTATNVCGGAPGAAFTVRVLAEWPYWLYLPLYYRHL